MATTHCNLVALFVLPVLSLGLPACAAGEALEPSGERPPGEAARAIEGVSDGDGDGDGVADGEDLCPSTPSGAAVVYHGCSAIDLVVRPERAIGAAGARIDAAARRLGASRLAPLARQVSAVQSSAGAAEQSLRGGAMCDGAASYRSAASSLVATAAQARADADRERGALSAAATDDGVSAPIADMHLALRALDESVAAAGELAAALDAVCASATRAPLSGVVVDVDDADRRIQLAGGAVLALPPSFTTSIHKDAMSEIDATMFGDGTGIVKTFEQSAPVVAVDPIDLTLEPCLALRVAPVQPMWPYFPSGEAIGTDGEAGLTSHQGGYALTDLAGYRALAAFGGGMEDAYFLERNMALVAQPRSCVVETDPASPSGYYRDTITLWLVQNGAVVNTLAWDLDVSDHPIILTHDLPAAHDLEVRYYRQHCTGGSCAGAKKELVASEIYPIRIAPQGSYCQAVYSKTELESLVDDDDFASAEVVGVDVDLFSPLAGTAYKFWADGYEAGAPAVLASGARVATPITVEQGKAFGIFRWEPMTPVGDIYQTPISVPLSGYPFPASGLLALPYTGTDRPAALRWPRVVGERGGREFAYSCRLPSIERDVINTCPGGAPSTLYTVPAEPSELVPVGQGNCGAWSHQCGTAGEFALDLGMPAGHTITAARAGEVVDMEEGVTTNCFLDPSAPCDANFVYVEHADGTVGKYFHMPPNGVYVSVGQHVERGDILGVVGNTGSSTAPHLHIEVGSSAQGWSIPIRYSAEVLSPALGPQTCYLPLPGHQIRRLQ